MNANVFFPMLLIGLIATVGDFVVPIILGKRYPNYSHLRDVISELGTRGSPVRKQTSAWLILLGILFICFGIGQGLQFVNHTWLHWLYVWGIMAFGIGAGILAGIYPEDASGMEETVSGKIHGICAGLGFIILILNPLWALGIDELNGLKEFNACLFFAAVITFILFVVSKKKEEGILGMSGFWQRLNLLAVYCPLVVNFIATKPP